MIQKMTADQLEQVAQIWLESNLEAHNFIDRNYWLDNFDTVKDELQLAEVYVFQADEQLKGFVGLEGDYIAGIFIQHDYRQQGIGRQLLDFLKANHQQLTLSVYQKNLGALKFYQQNNFKVTSADIESDNQEKEYQMEWKKS